MHNMKKALLIVQIFVLSVMALNAQKGNCITLDSSQKKLFLNGDNFTLIDNALRCYKLNSITRDRDSIIRIWILEDDFPDTPTTWRVKMFEFGKKQNKFKAELHILEWNYEGERSLPVKCIK